MRASLLALAKYILLMVIFTLDTDYSCETGYPFDDSRQIGNKS